MHLPVSPTFQLGPLTMHWYGLTMTTAIIVGTLVAMRYVKRFGFPGQLVLDLLVWCLVPAVLGARLYFVFIQSPRTSQGIGHYLASPLTILAIWQGGIHIYGAFIFGGIALILFLWWRRLPVPTFLDAAGLALPIAQAIGRLGNFINQELYGPPTTLPWGLRIDPQYRVPPYDDLIKYPESTRFQPLFLYELTWNLIGFALLFWISRCFARWLRPGDLFLMYVIWYPFGRFWLEFLRADSWFFPGTPFDLVHLLSALAILIASLTLYARHRRTPAQPDLLTKLGDGIQRRYAALRDTVLAHLPEPAPDPELALALSKTSTKPVAAQTNTPATVSRVHRSGQQPLAETNPEDRSVVRKRPRASSIAARSRSATSNR